MLRKEDQPASRTDLAKRVLASPLREAEPGCLSITIESSPGNHRPFRRPAGIRSQEEVKSGQLLFEPVVGVWLGVERIDFNVSGSPIERDRFV